MASRLRWCGSNLLSCYCCVLLSKLTGNDVEQKHVSTNFAGGEGGGGRIRAERMRERQLVGAMVKSLRKSLITPQLSHGCEAHISPRTLPCSSWLTAEPRFVAIPARTSCFIFVDLAVQTLSVLAFSVALPLFYDE